MMEMTRQKKMSYTSVRLMDVSFTKTGLAIWFTLAIRICLGSQGLWVPKTSSRIPHATSSYSWMRPLGLSVFRSCLVTGPQSSVQLTDFRGSGHWLLTNGLFRHARDPMFSFMMLVGASVIGP